MSEAQPITPSANTQGPPHHLPMDIPQALHNIRVVIRRMEAIRILLLLLQLLNQS